MAETAKKTAPMKKTETEEGTSKNPDVVKTEEIVRPGQSRSKADHERDRLEMAVANARMRGYTSRANELQAQLDAR